MRPRDRIARALLGAGLLLGSLALATPLAAGRWDPPWLRLAEDISLDTSEGSFQPGQVSAPFTVEQCDLEGRLRWRLRGRSLEGGDAADLFRDQAVLEPRLELFSADQTWSALLQAKRARVRVVEGGLGGDAERRVRLDLGPELQISTGEFSLSGETLVVWFDPQAPSALRLESEDPLELRGARASGEPWRLRAQGVRGSGLDQTLYLRGPIELEGGPLQGGPLDAFTLAGSASQAELQPLSFTASARPAAQGPWRLILTEPRLQGERSAGGHLQLSAERCELFLAGAARAGAAAPDSASSGLDPGLRPDLRELLLAGAVAGALRRPADAAYPEALEVELAGEELRLSPEGLRLQGSPARFVEGTRGLRCEGRWIEVRRAPLAEGSTPAAPGQPQPRRRKEGASAGALEVTAEAVTRLSLREPLRAGLPRATWEGQVGSLRARLAPAAGEVAALGSETSGAGALPGAGVAALGSAAPALAFLERLDALEVREGLELRREPGPDRLELSALDYERRGDLRELSARDLRATTSAVESGSHAAPWDLSAGSLSIVARGPLASLVAPLTSASGAPLTSASPGAAGLPWEQLAGVERFGAADFAAARRAPPPAAAPGRAREAEQRRALRGARGLRAERLEYGADRRLLARGAVALELGALRLEAPALDFSPAQGQLDARQLTLTLRRLAPQPGGGLAREEYLLRAQEGRALLALDPRAWAAERLRRKGRARAGARLTLPEPLREVRLRGEVRGSGARQARASADELHLQGRELQLRGQPARLVEERGEVNAARIDLSWSEAGVAELGSSTPGPGSLSRGSEVRDATQGQLRAQGQVLVRGQVGARRFALQSDRVEARLFELVGADARAGFPLGPFHASGREGVTLEWSAPVSGGAREIKLRTQDLRGDGRARDAAGKPALALELRGRWASTLALPKRGLAQLSGGEARALIDPSVARAGPNPGEGEEAYLRRLLRGLDLRGGFRLAAEGLEAQAERARLDPERGAYVLEGDPAVVRRGGLRQAAQTWVLRLSED